MDLTDAIRWAGEATTPGTTAHDAVRAGLRVVLRAEGDVNVTNPVSSARDGVTPDLTRVLLCHLERQTVCVKFYPLCPDGRKQLERHACLLSRLRLYVPVPVVLDVCLDTAPFGFPALITSATGRPLDHELLALGETAQTTIVASIARGVAALHGVMAEDLAIGESYDPATIVSAWRRDAEWYEKHADQAGPAAGLVRRAASSLASHSQAPSSGCVLHRDLTPYNVLAENGAFAALVDWDHMGFSARQEDIGKMIIGLLGMLSIPRRGRFPLANAFLHTYAQATSISGEELCRQSLPFALDTILDWVVGGKNAPRDELAWATEQIMNEGSIQPSEGIALRCAPGEPSTVPIGP